MTTFNPRDFWDPSGWFESPDRGGGNPRAANREVAHRWAVILSFCLCFASLAPPGLFRPALAALLMVAGIASLGVAVVQRQNPTAPHLTSWDEASWSFLLGLGLHVWLV
jgi:hypothetical protein